jgi:hypothetical protein
MKKISLMMLAVLACMAAQGETFELAPNATGQFNIHIPAGSLLKIRARLELPDGKEGWGGYFMGLELNGKPLPAPVNTGRMVYNLARLPIDGAELYSASRGAWFVKADSDDIAFNGEGSFNRTSFLGKANTSYDPSGYTNAYYDKVFEVDAGDSVLAVRNLSPRYRLRGEITVMETPHRELMFFVPVPGKNIYPWSFPQPEELKKTLKIRACRGEFEPLVLAVKNRGGDAAFKWRFEGLNVPVDVRVQEYTPAESADHLKYAELAGHAVVLPDRLTGADEWRVEAGKAGSLWMIFRIPEDAAPGSYRAKLILNETFEFPLEIEVLPFELAPSEKIYGLWTNSLPGRDPERCKRQCLDLREHGINTFFLDQWTVPVSIDVHGNIDISRFEAALAWLKAENLNQKVLIFGLIGSLPKQIAAAAKTDDVRSPEWGKMAERLFQPMADAAGRAGFRELYLHLSDEPDIHPNVTAEFEAMCQSLKKHTSLKIAANATIAGMMHWKDLIDLNICAIYNGVLQGWNGETYRNTFFPQWTATPEQIRQHVRYGYTQVRSTHGLNARVLYGFMMDKMELEGMWGFAYYWGKDGWNIAWPFPEKDGRWGTTAGWEMLRAGIIDSRYYQTLLKAGGEFALPEPKTLESMPVEELHALRNNIINQLLKVR